MTLLLEVIGTLLGGKLVRRSAQGYTGKINSISTEKCGVTVVDVSKRSTLPFNLEQENDVKRKWFRPDIAAYDDKHGSGDAKSLLMIAPVGGGLSHTATFKSSS